MLRLPEIRRKRSLDWKQLVPHCSYPECSRGSSWTGVLHRVSGFRVNGQHWFCSAHCLLASLEEHLLEHYFESPNPASNRTTLPMGLMMLSRGVISDLQLRDALELQRSSGTRIGDCLQRLGFISPEDIASVVATQWGCPVFPADSVQPGCSMLVPSCLIERYRLLPVHLVSQGRRLFVAFCDRVNHTALVAIDRMLGCQTEACVIPEPRLLEVIEYRKHDTSGEVAVSRPTNAAETARIILSYSQQTGAGDIRLQTVEGNIWVRFLSKQSHLDLVFEVIPH